MAEMHEIIDSLLKKRGISGYKMCNDLGLSRSFITELRKGRAKSVKVETAQKIADYFGVSVGYLLGNEQKETAPAEAEADEMSDILQEFRENPELKTLFSLSKNATPEELRQYINVIKALRGNGVNE